MTDNYPCWTIHIDGYSTPLMYSWNDVLREVEELREAGHDVIVTDKDNHTITI